MKLPFWPNPLGYRNISLGLNRVLDLLSRIDNPHLKLPPVIHLAGTNGKGSTLAFLKAIFAAANLKTHTYISPHLVNFNERITLAGKEIDDDFLNQVLNECKKAAEINPEINPTFFEGITVAAFLAFSRIKADVLLLETGMGGRLDATNVINNPIATIITPISFDHQEFLGDSLEKIAFEKAGIIKAKCPVIISKQDKIVLKVLQDVAKKNNSPTIIFDQDFYESDLELSLAGSHQKINAATAIAAIKAQNHFKISDEQIAQGLKNALWPARLQLIKTGEFAKNLPKNFQLILDGSHNQAGAKTISDFLENDKHSKNYLLCAMLKDKDSFGFLDYLAKQTEMLVAMKIPDEEKSKEAKEIKEIAVKLGINSDIGENFAEAIEKITKYHSEKYQSHPAKIIICGSLYLAGKFLSL